MGSTKIAKNKMPVRNSYTVLTKAYVCVCVCVALEGLTVKPVTLSWFPVWSESTKKGMISY